MVRYIRKADRVYDPKDPYRFCYEHSTPELEAEFNRGIGNGNGPVSFTRPGGFPPAPATAAPTAEQTPPPAKPRHSSKRQTTR